MPKFAPTTTNMNDVFKQHPKPDVMKDLIETYRAKARQTLQETMPTSIIRLQALIAQESDPSSPFWIGQLDNGAYLPENLKLYQPGQLVPQGTGLKEVVTAGDIKGVVADQSPIDLGGIKEVIAEIQPGISQSKDDVDQGVERDSDTPNSLVGVDMKQKVGAHYFEISPRNANQEQVIKIVRAEAESLMFALNDLRVWLSLETPIIEDGNSFGADVQSHLSTEIDKSFNKAAGYMNGCKRHFDDRAQAVKNWVYMPNVADYPAAIAGSDRIDHVLARGYLRNMLVIYGGLMSKLEKNWGKVISPKGSGGGGDAMY